MFVTTSLLAACGGKLLVDTSNDGRGVTSGAAGDATGSGSMSSEGDGPAALAGQAGREQGGTASHGGTAAQGGADAGAAGLAGSDTIGARGDTAETCRDYQQDGTETDVDCGGLLGMCARCQAGKTCKVSADCQSAHYCSVSLPHICVADAPAPLGDSCQTDAACASGACDVEAQQCVADACKDHHQDGSESDADCGGADCAKCALGRQCSDDLDCTTNACDGATHVCVPNQCIDHRTDGLETDVDCGGTNWCSRCSVGKHCNFNYDCQAGHKCDTAAEPKVCASL